MARNADTAQGIDLQLGFTEACRGCSLALAIASCLIVTHALLLIILEVVQYETAEGSCPFATWLAALDARAAVKVRTAIARIETGNFGDVKPVSEGVSERRINFGPGYRIYFGQEGQRLVILLVGGTKKRQQHDINQAKAYWQDYKQRKRGG